MNVTEATIFDIWSNSKKLAFEIIKEHVRSAMIPGEEFFWSDLNNKPVFLISNVVYFNVPPRLTATIEALIAYNNLYGFNKEIITK